MRNGRRVLKAFALSLMAALGLMAFTAAGTQAAHVWDVAAQPIATDVLIDGNLKGNDEARLLIPGLLTEIRCLKMDVELDSRLRTTGDILAFLLYLECHTFVKHILSACTPEILLVKAKLLPFLHNNVIKLLATPDDGANFTQIHYNEELCALPPLISITGSYVFECETLAGVLRNCKTASSTQLLRPASEALMLSLYTADTLKYGLNTAFLDGRAEIFIHAKSPSAGQSFNALHI